MRYLILLATLLLFGCKPNLIFNKERWNQENNTYEFRERMVKDLIKNHLKPGMSKNEIIKLIGNNVTIHDWDYGSELTFKIKDYYFLTDIDPERTVILVVDFDDQEMFKKAYLTEID